jgi:thiazole synthase ThiGH ThiG subunit
MNDLPPDDSQQEQPDMLVIDGVSLTSRLIMGTGGAESGGPGCASRVRHPAHHRGNAAAQRHEWVVAVPGAAHDNNILLPNTRDASRRAKRSHRGQPARPSKPTGSNSR